MRNFYYPESVVERKLPENLKEKDKFLFEVELKKKFPSVVSKEFNNITIYPNGICFKDKKFLIELFYDKKKIDFKSKIKLYKKTFVPTLRNFFLKKRKMI